MSAKLRLRVLQVCSAREAVYGAAISLLTLARAQRSAGHRVEFGTFKGKRFGTQVRAQGFAAHEFAVRLKIDPVAIAQMARTIRQGRFDVVHGFEPGLPSLSYLALTTAADTLTAATFFSPDRLGYPTRRSRRDRLRIRVDALLATSEETMIAAAERFHGDYRLVPLGVDTQLFRPRRKRRVIALELEIAGRPATRAQTMWHSGASIRPRPSR